MDTKHRCLILAIFMFLISITLLIFLPEQEGICLVLLGTLIFICSITALAFLDMYRLKVARSYSIRGALTVYVFNKTLSAVGTLLLWKFNQLAKDLSKQQATLLHNIIKQNKKTKFVKDHNLCDVSGVNDFKRLVPLTRYTYYAKYIEEIVKHGQADVLFPGKADYLAITSGTSSGKSKIYPKNLSVLRRKAHWFVLLLKRMERSGVNVTMRKFPYVKVDPKFTYSDLGVIQGPASAMLEDHIPASVVTPDNGRGITLERESLYIHAIFSLLEEEINHFAIQNMSTALAFFKLIESEWRSMCNTIETGHLPKELNIDETKRNFLEKHLGRGNPQRANAIREVLGRGSKDMVPRIWPTCRFMIGITTGTFQLPGEIVKQKYFGGMPILTPFHIGTECWYGCNFFNKENMSEYVCVAPVAFFEFIKEEDVHLDNPTTYFGHQVEPGKRYEVVVTTSDGLYRYRTEDIIQITGFYDTVPKYAFVQRATDLLSVCTERVPEYLLREALFKVAGEEDVTLVEYTSCSSFLSESLKDNVSGQRFYQVFVEIEEHRTLKPSFAEKVDKELMDRHQIYAAFRRKGTISPVTVSQVKNNTFRLVKEKHLESNSDAYTGQYKVPKILTREILLKVLLDNML